MARYSDETLGAYLDGELPAEDARAIGRAEASDPLLRARIEALRAVSHAVHQSFAGAEREPVPERLQVAFDRLARRAGRRKRSWPVAIWPGPRRRHWVYGLAGAAAAVVIALGLGAFLSGVIRVNDASLETYEDAWIEQVKRSYDVYAGIYRDEARAMVDVDGADAGVWFADKLNRPIAVPDLSTHGLTLKGGRLVIVAGQPSAQFLYVAEDGSPFALSVVPSAGQDRTVAAREDKEGAVTLLHWRAKNYGYALIGNLAPDAMRSLADEIAPQLNPGV